jgi:multiple sugar transport system substrate-binding protein
MTTPLRGLTWDHPRGYQVLDALSRLDRAGRSNPYGGVRLPVIWSRQPLAGFEARPVRELAAEFDLLVIDHPGVGEAVEDGALMPLDELFATDEIVAWQRDTVGGCGASYRWHDRQWAAPIDATAQVGVARAGSISRPPATWDEAVAFAGNTPTVLCLGGPHALLMLCAVAVALGASPQTSGSRFLDRDTGRQALDVMRRLYAVADREASTEHPISVLDAMAAGTGPGYCPLVFGYVSYQRRPDRFPHLLTAFDAPAGVAGGRRGSVLGGTGMAVSRFAADASAAAEHIRRVTSERVQRTLYSNEGGQAAHLCAWLDPEIDRSVGGFYSATQATVTDAWVRPRFAGFIDFQREASAVVRCGLISAAAPNVVLDELDDRFRRAQVTPVDGRAG